MDMTEVTPVLEEPGGSGGQSRQGGHGGERHVCDTGQEGAVVERQPPATPVLGARAQSLAPHAGRAVGGLVLALSFLR